MVDSGFDFLDENRRSSWIRLRTLIVLRWVAVVGQLAAITLAQWLYALQLELGLCYLAVGISVVGNLIAMFVFPENKRLSESENFLMVMFDLLQLCFLLFLTGGLNNPFSLLVLGPVTISQLTEAFPISRQAVTKHLDTLADAGLVETERRGRERIVTFRPEPLREATDWVTTVESRWDRRLAALALLLAAESDVAETAQPTPDRSGRFAMNKNNGEGTTP